MKKINTYTFSLKPSKIVYFDGMDVIGASKQAPETTKQDFTTVDKATISFIKHLYKDKKFDYFFVTLRRSAAEQIKYVQNFITGKFKIDPRKQRSKLARIIRGMYKVIGSTGKFKRLEKIALASLAIDKKSATFKAKHKIPYSNVRLTTNIGLDKRVGAYMNSLVAKTNPKGAIYQALDSIGEAVIKLSDFKWEDVRASINKILKPYGFYIHALSATRKVTQSAGKTNYRLDFDAKIVCYNYGLANKTLRDSRKKRKLESNVKTYASTKAASPNKRVS